MLFAQQVSGEGNRWDAGIPGSRYVEIADASHGWPVTHTGQANAMLGEHFAAAEALNR